MIHILQCLCPARHAIVGLGYDDEYTKPDEAHRQCAASMAIMINAGAMKPVCGICGAFMDQWHWEDGITKYKTMEEATPALQALEAANIATRRAIDQAKETAANN